MARNLGKVGNLPVVLIEGDRREEASHARKFEWEELKTAYISPWILQVQENPGTMDVEDFNIRVIDTHKEILSDTE